MKILYIITQAEEGGAQQYVLTLAKYFKGIIAAGQEADRLFTQAESLGIKTCGLRHLKREIKPYHDLMAVWEIRQLINQLKPDIVHLNSTKTGILGSFAAMGLKTKVVYTAHGFVFNEDLPFWIKNFYIALEKIASDFRDCIISVSEYDRNSAIKHKIINPEKLKVVYNGLPDLKFYEAKEAKNKLRLPLDKITVGCIANFYKTKGLDILIKAVGQLPSDAKSRCQVIICGSGPELENCKNLIKNLNLENIVSLPGQISKAYKYLKAFDIFAFPSRKEGMPFALLEAMQAASAIITTNAGGIPETVSNGAIIVEKENIRALSLALLELINNPAKRENLSFEALKRSKIFSEKNMLESTYQTYLHLL